MSIIASPIAHMSGSSRIHSSQHFNSRPLVCWEQSQPGSNKQAGGTNASACCPLTRAKGGCLEPVPTVLHNECLQDQPHHLWISRQGYKYVDIATSNFTGCTCCGMHVALQLTVMQDCKITCRTTSLSKITLKNLLENTPVSTSGSSLIFLAFTYSMPRSMTNRAC